MKSCTTRQTHSHALKSKSTLQPWLEVFVELLTFPKVIRVDSTANDRPLPKFPEQEDSAILLALAMLPKEQEEFCVPFAVSKMALRFELRACFQMLMQVEEKHVKQGPTLDALALVRWMPPNASFLH